MNESELTYQKYLNSVIDSSGVGIAYQYLVRQSKAEEEKVNPYWKDLNLSLADAVIKPVDRQTTKRIIEEYEWLGCLPAISSYQYGIFFDDVCGGVVVFSPEYSENLGVWDKYGFTGKILLLSRGVCLHWTPKNTASKLIMSAIKMLPEKYEIITATIDHLAGEIGTIYQSCNFYYVGAMRENGKACSRERLAIIVNGKLYGERAIRGKLGTQKKEKILEAYPDAKFVKQKSKDRYFLFRGKNKNNHLNAISQLLKPYPKRKTE